MCMAAGAYVVILLLEDVIVGVYSTDAASQNQGLNVTNHKAAYGVNQKEIAKSLDKVKQSNGKQKYHYFFTILPKVSEKVHTNLQKERINRKQYEIMNRLWTKPNVIRTTTPHNEDGMNKRTLKRVVKDIPIVLSVSTLPLKTTTASNIEFYYSDDLNDHLKETDCVEPNCQQNPDKIIDSKTKTTFQASFFVYHLKGTAKPQYVKFTTLRSNYSLFINEQAIISDILLNKLQQVSQVKDKRKSSLKRNFLPLKKYLFDNAPLIHTTKPLVTFRNLTVYEVSVIVTTKNVPESTTLYDKIKFFEMYDQDTKKPNIKNVVRTITNKDDENKVNNTKKVHLEDVDQGSHAHKQAKHSKKHIVENYEQTRENKSQPKGFVNDLNLKTQTHETSHATNEDLKINARRDHNNILPRINKTTLWSKYPFAAVYIYEVSQVHCDAAGITAHWLVASGSCLSRVDMNPDGEGRSAFVAYCGEQWWQPVRVSYVKYSVVHPSYHHRDKTRRHLYNIGLIQVVNSMISACAGWAPVSLMSHQFIADSQGSEALAIGWGLDRYDTRYGASELPKIPLSLYKGQVYLDSCPGNVGYSKAKRLDGEGGIRNVHCLSLPPYYGEETDPVHGGLLLVSDKLIALYLQEERRPYGEQSAQYTAIWRLIPWMMDVAREPEDFVFEM